VKKILILFFIAISNLLVGQKDFSFQLGAGPNYYFNNLVIFHENLEPLNHSIYSKLMWNTRYRLSFGIESGHVQLYRLNDFTANDNSAINMTVIPIHAAIEMKLSNHLFASFTFGPSFFKNNIVATKGEQITHTFSTADISFGLGYRHTFKNHMFLGLESKYFYSSKSEDRNLSLPFFMGINF